MSKIEWTDSVWEPVGGCRHASEGCRNCYAETLLGNLSGITPSRFRPIPRRYDGLVQMRSKRSRFTGAIKLWPDKLVQPLSWRKPRTVFVCSQSDLFYEERPFEDIAAVYAIMAATPHIKYLVLTKRPERRRAFFAWLQTEVQAHGSLGLALIRYLSGYLGNGTALSRAAVDALTTLMSLPLDNEAAGVSVENQATADERIPVLLATPAAMRFVSYEPALGPVDFDDWLSGEYAPQDFGGAMAEQNGPAIDWVIAGAESGPGARPAELEWFRSVRDQCEDAAVPYFLKQADVCGACSGRGYHRYVSEPCHPCSGAGRAGTVRKGNPALDGQVHDARPAWLT